MFFNLQTTQKVRLCVLLYMERGAFYLLWRIGVQWSGVCANNLPALTNEQARIGKVWSMSAPRAAISLKG